MEYKDFEVGLYASRYISVISIAIKKDNNLLIFIDNTGNLRVLCKRKFDSF